MNFDYDMELDEKRILVTGGNGFLGKHVVRNLENSGVNNVFVPSSRDHDLRNVDTTTVTASDGDCIVFDSSTQKFEASAGIDGGYYG